MDMYQILVRKPDKTELKLVTTFFEHTFLGLVKSFTINFSNFTVAFYLMD
jgi:hypothetical protein